MAVGSRPSADLTTPLPLKAIIRLNFPLADIQSAPPIFVTVTSAMQRQRSLIMTTASDSSDRLKPSERTCRSNGWNLIQ